MVYLEWRRRAAHLSDEGYGTGHSNEPESIEERQLAHPLVALTPLLMVGLLNLWLSGWLPSRYSAQFDFASAGIAGAPQLDTSRLTAIWAVECALLAAIALVLVWCARVGIKTLITPLNAAIAGAVLAALNTASEYGFGAVIAALPGFRMVSQGLAASVHDPLINVAVTSNVLAGITGSASGGMSIALAAMAEEYVRQASAAGIPNEVLHRVAAMASGGMDTLPHNGAIITLLAITGLTHRQAYKDIFVLTFLKTAAAFVVIFAYQLFGIV
jgi:H+/gluconate symporter-like permease